MGVTTGIATTSSSPLPSVPSLHSLPSLPACAVSRAVPFALALALELLALELALELALDSEFCWELSSLMAERELESAGEGLAR